METVKKVCKTSYGISTAAVRMIDGVVRVNGLQKLSKYIVDGEGRSNIVYFTAKFIKNASFYAFKEATKFFIPGGKAVSEIYSNTINEMETESKEKRDMSCDKEIIGNLSKITNTTGPLRLLVDEAEKLESKRDLKFGSDQNKVQVDSFAYRTPEDVLRFFMMMEFIGTRYLDNSLVHDHRQQMKK